MATNKKKEPLTNERLATILDANIRLSTGYATSKLSKERERALDYYTGALPRPTHAGNSKYVSQDLYDEVESVKATILETFAASQNIVQFAPQGPDDVEMARIATEYCSFVVYRQNEGLKLFSDVLQDGLLARVGIAMYWWEEGSDEEDIEIGPAPLDQLVTQLSGDDIEVKSLDDHQDGTYTAHATRKVDRSHVCIEAVPPEQFGISAHARSIKKAKLVYRRMPKTASELREEGYDDDLIEKLSGAGTTFATDPEVTARHSESQGEQGLTDDEDLEDGEVYEVFEAYALVDIERTGTAKLWRIVKCGSVILKKEKVASRPFAAFTPLPVSHSFYGSSFASKVEPIQNARTILTRAILDHTVTTTAPRWLIVKGGLTNPRELMDNRVGGLVNVNRPDAVMPLPQASLNPFVFQTLQMLEANKENVTGVSSLSKGLNKDAVSSQNSQGLIEDLVSLSDRRMKVIARQFSEFLCDLYVGVYELVLTYQNKATAMEIAGNWVNITPSQWRERAHATSQISVGYGDQEREAQKFVQIDQYLRSDPQLSSAYTADKRYNVMRRILDHKGIKDIDSILVRPQDRQQPQPDPMAMAELALRQAETEATKLKAQAEIGRVQLESRKLDLNDAQHSTKLQLDAAHKADNIDLEYAKLAEKTAVNQAELKLAAAAPKLEGIAAPNG